MNELAQLLVDNPIAGFIAASEVGLWVLLVLGLVLRYVARLRRTGAVVLALIPALDLALCVAVAVDLHRGAEADVTHGLAAVYLGFSVAFGPAIVRWADVRFAHRFAGGPPPPPKPRRGPERLAALWREWLRVVLAAAITSAVLLALIVGIADAGQSEVLEAWMARVWALVGLWLLFGPVWELPSRGRSADPATR